MPVFFKAITFSVKSRQFENLFIELAFEKASHDKKFENTVFE